MLTDNSPEPTLFSAVLRPHRSLHSVGFVVLMAVYGVVSFVAGVVFSMMGAWPIVAFFALDVLVLYLAFRINYARALGEAKRGVTRTVLTIA